MNYEKRYKEALSKAKDMLNNTKNKIYLYLVKNILNVEKLISE